MVAVNKNLNDKRLRFEVGTAVLCDVGDDYSEDWKLGMVAAHNYRESHWPSQKTAPYMVLLYGDDADTEDEGPRLIYVPKDQDDYCRKATPEDLRTAKRKEAETALRRGDSAAISAEGGLYSPASGKQQLDTSASHRRGRCHCCNPNPYNWTAAELYSRHYRAPERNGLEVNLECFDLGFLRVGDEIDHSSSSNSIGKGFHQCPMLSRLPPGIKFFDDGSMVGKIRYDPHRGSSYNVEFVAVSTSDWDDAIGGVVRVEIRFSVLGNDQPPPGFDKAKFVAEHERASGRAFQLCENISQIWDGWDPDLKNEIETCHKMGKELRKLRDLLERYPRLENGMYWAHLGGFHVNLHKLLENTLFESELYLGYALMSESSEVRALAEEGLQGCYQQRLMEAARFLWMDGLKQIMEGQYPEATDTLRSAGAKKDRAGWAVNCAEIGIAEAAAQLLQGVVLAISANRVGHNKVGERWILGAIDLLERCQPKAFVGDVPHPWFQELQADLKLYRSLQHGRRDELKVWFQAFRSRTIVRSAQAMAGHKPFPPKVRPRQEDAAALVQRLPGHISETY